MNRYTITLEFCHPTTGHVIRGHYDEMTGRLDLVPKQGLFEEQTIAYRQAYETTEEFCTEHAINYFYFSEVKATLREERVDMRTLDIIED